MSQSKVNGMTPEQEKSNGEPSNTPSVRDMSESPESEFGDDIVRQFSQLQRQGKFCGTICGKKVCIDNLGWTFDPQIISRELQQHLPGIERIQFASIEIESSIWNAGHGCIEFNSIENAVKGMIKLDTLYLDCPESPIPRPIVNHFPVWENFPRGEHDFPGYILDRGVCPHFCQKNTREYDIALEWRHLMRYQAKGKKRLCDIYTKRIWKSMAKYRSQSGDTALQSVFLEEAKKQRTRTLVLKGVSTELTSDQIRSAVEVADRCGNIIRQQCPVTERPTGTVFIQTSTPERAISFAEDLKQFLYVLGRSPRPAEVDMLTIGPSNGFEGIFDQAVEMAFEVKMHQLDPSKRTSSHIIDIQTISDLKRRCCQDVRRVLNEMTKTRMAWKAETHENQLQWHLRQKDYVSTQLLILNKLEAVVPRLYSQNKD